MAFLYLSQSGDLIYDEPFGAFTLSHLIFKLTANQKLNLLLSICLFMSLYSFNNDLMISSALEWDSSRIIVFSLML